MISCGLRVLELHCSGFEIHAAVYTSGSNQRGLPIHTKELTVSKFRGDTVFSIPLLHER